MGSRLGACRSGDSPGTIIVKTLASPSMLASFNEVTQQQQLLNIPNYELSSIKLHVVYTIKDDPY